MATSNILTAHIEPSLFDALRGYFGIRPRTDLSLDCEYVVEVARLIVSLRAPVSRSRAQLELVGLLLPCSTSAEAERLAQDAIDALVEVGDVVESGRTLSSATPRLVRVGASCLVLGDHGGGRPIIPARQKARLQWFAASRWLAVTDEDASATSPFGLQRTSAEAWLGLPHELDMGATALFDELAPRFRPVSAARDLDEWDAFRAEPTNEAGWTTGRFERFGSEHARVALGRLGWAALRRPAAHGGRGHDYALARRGPQGDLRSLSFEGPDAFDRWVLVASRLASRAASVGLGRPLRWSFTQDLELWFPPPRWLRRALATGRRKDQVWPLAWDLPAEIRPTMRELLEKLTRA